MFQCGKFTFAANFECANLANVLEVKPTDGCTPASLCASCNVRINKIGNNNNGSSTNVAGNFSLHLQSNNNISNSSSSNKLSFKGASSTVLHNISPQTLGTKSAESITVSQLQTNQKLESVCEKASPVDSSLHTYDGKYPQSLSTTLVPASVHQATQSLSSNNGGGSNGSRYSTLPSSSGIKGTSTTLQSIAPPSTINSRPDHEFQLHTRPDCSNTEFENNNRTWFYFSIVGGSAGCKVRLRIMNLNKQVKLYAQGMRPVYQQQLLGRPPTHNWARASAPTHCWSVDGSTVLSWLHTVPSGGLVTYYAFTFPYTYTQLQDKLLLLDNSLPPNINISPSLKDDCQVIIPNVVKAMTTQPSSSPMDKLVDVKEDCDDIYYVRELVIKSLDSHRLDLLTITSRLGIMSTREERLPGLFPDSLQFRPYKFENKKVIFVSARVHPGETPSSFVFNGFLDFITSHDPRASKLRDLYVFKLIPMLNPDGVVRGHYRTDQRGVNLNRVYGSPSIDLHPTIYAARSLLLYYHFGEQTNSDLDDSSATELVSQYIVDGANTPFESASSDTLTTNRQETRSVSPMGKKISKVTELAMLDEDTCHSFGDAGRCQEAKHLGKSVASMEMDEPSASGWDISSNISVDSSIHTSSIFRAPDMADIHDDCSNISGISEAETGVTSMFGALAAVSTECLDSYQSTSPKYEALGSKSITKWPSPSLDSTDILCHKCNLPKRSMVHKCNCIGPTTRSVSKFSSTLLKPISSIAPQPALLTETNLKLHCSASEPSFVVPFKSNSFLAPDSVHQSSGNAQSSPRVPPPSFQSALQMASINTSSLGSGTPGPSFTFSRYSNAPSKSTTIDESMSLSENNFGIISGRNVADVNVSATTFLSSSESEAEVGIPGKEGLQVSLMPVRPSLCTSRASVTTSSSAATASGNSQPVAGGVEKRSILGAGGATCKPEESGLHMYVDLHGHASKRGIFLYGNWFRDLPTMVDNLLLAKLLSINCANFDFNACNFTEKNMTVKDRKNGLSKEGSGRVAIMRLTGILRSYTLECNYNTGRSCNATPPLPGAVTTTAGAVGGGGRGGKRGAVTLAPSLTTPSSHLPSPPKYTPAIFEECGRELAVSMLDAVEEPPALPVSGSQFTASSKLRSATTVAPGASGSINPSKPLASRSLLRSGPRAPVVGRGSINHQSRLPSSQYGSLAGVKLWLRQFLTSPSSAVHTAHMSPHASKTTVGGWAATIAGKLSPLVSPSPLPSPRVARVPRRGAAGISAGSPIASPKQLRSKGQGKPRRYSWTAVDAENREPSSSGVAGSVSPCSAAATASRSSFGKFGIGGSPKVKTHKIKMGTPKKSTVARSLMFTDVGEASCSSAETSKKMSKVRSIQGLTASVSITPNLSVKLSISDAPEIPSLIKKVEKVRRERSKAVGSSFKKLKTGSGQSRRASQEKDDAGGAAAATTASVACASPRSPLSCVFQGGITDDPSIKTKTKILKLPVKRRAKVSRTLSKCIVSKSLDVLPSASVAVLDSCVAAVIPGTSADLSTSTIKVLRKKLKSGNSGSESDLAMLQASLPVDPLHWSVEPAAAAAAAADDDDAANAAVVVVAVASTKTPTSAVLGKKESGLLKKKKRKVPGRKSL